MQEDRHKVRINKIVAPYLPDKDYLNYKSYMRLIPASNVASDKILYAIAKAIEEEFSISLPKETIAGWRTLGDIYFTTLNFNGPMLSKDQKRLLGHICRINDHPIKEMSDTVKRKYLTGLACVLYDITKGSETMKTLFSQWAYSIAGEDMSYLFTSQPDASVKEALSLNRKGIHFFRCKHEFFFDCFYLIESYDSILRDNLKAYLNLVGKNIFTKTALNNTIKYFEDNKGMPKVAECLIDHRLNNQRFNEKKSKKILVVANVSAGKSTLINALLGHKFNRVKTTACTSRLCEIYNKPTEDGFVYYKDSQLFYDSDIESYCSDDATNVGMHYRSTLGKHNVCMVDTPGVNNSTDSTHWTITTEAIKANDYDLLLFISNGQYNGTTDEKMILEYIHKNCKTPVLFALNQLDRFKSSSDSISDMIVNYSDELKSIGFKQPQIYPLSAEYAFLLRYSNFLDEDEAYDLELLRKRFSKAYYDLPTYIGSKSTRELGRTGIINLEQGIINILNKRRS